MSTGIVFIIARILMGLPFVVAGVRNFRNLDRLVGLMEGRKVPNARIVTIIGVAVQLVSAALIVIGVLVPLAALGLAVFLAAATLIVHPYWASPRKNASRTSMRASSTRPWWAASCYCSR